MLILKSSTAPEAGLGALTMVDILYVGRFKSVSVKYGYILDGTWAKEYSNLVDGRFFKAAHSLLDATFYTTPDLGGMLPLRKDVDYIIEVIEFTGRVI